MLAEPVNVQHTLVFASHELTEIRARIEAQQLRIDTIRHCERTPTVHLAVSQWLDSPQSRNAISRFEERFATAYRGSRVLTQPEYQLSSALSGLQLAL
jgi:hypothetical protein